jgi:Tfp pilus assembly protein PilN
LNSADGILKEVQSSSQKKAFNNFKEEVKQTNDQLEYINQLASQENNYSSIVKNLSGFMPPGVKIKSVSLNGNKVELSGNADSRQAVVSLRDALEKSPDFQKLDSPLSNFLKQSNIDFYFTFEIKKF